MIRRSAMRLMSRTLWAFCMIASIGCTSTPPRPTAPTINYFDCDVPPGRFSHWDQTVSSTGMGISGTLQLIEGRKDPKWLPSASVYLMGSDNRQSVGLKMLLFNDDPDNVNVVVLDSGSKNEHGILASIPWMGKAVAFSVSTTGSGEYAITVDGKSEAVHAPGFLPQKIELVCSTGQFKFADVVIGGHQ
jgi:hypothetical protein